MLKENIQCLSICDIEIKAPIGVFDFEKKQGNDFQVSVDIWADFCLSMHSDNLEDTLDYQLIYDIVHKIMTKEYNLIESCTKLIADEISFLPFPIQKTRVFIKKLAPPLEGKVGYTSFEWVNVLSE